MAQRGRPKGSVKKTNPEDMLIEGLQANLKILSQIRRLVESAIEEIRTRMVDGGLHTIQEYTDSLQKLTECAVAIGKTNESSIKALGMLQKSTPPPSNEEEENLTLEELLKKVNE